MQSANLSNSFFSLFDLPVSFDIDSKVLTKRYRTLQRTVHPDRFANAAESERRLSVQLAARINEGFQTLKDPLARGRYLLELRGIELDELDTAFDGTFLMEQIELRERMGDVKESENPQQQLLSISDDISAKVKTIIEGLAENFLVNEPSSLEKAKELIRKFQFFRRLEEEVDAIEENLTK